MYPPTRCILCGQPAVMVLPGCPYCAAKNPPNDSDAELSPYKTLISLNPNSQNSGPSSVGTSHLSPVQTHLRQMGQTDLIVYERANFGGNEDLMAQNAVDE